MKSLLSWVLFVPSFVDLAFVSSTFICVFTCYDFTFRLCILPFRLISWLILLLFMSSSITCYFYLGFSHFFVKPLTASSLVHDLTIHEFAIRGFFSCLSFFFSCVLLSCFWLTFIGLWRPKSEGCYLGVWAPFTSSLKTSSNKKEHKENGHTSINYINHLRV